MFPHRFLGFQRKYLGYVAVLDLRRMNPMAPGIAAMKVHQARLAIKPNKVSLRYRNISSCHKPMRARIATPRSQAPENLLDRNPTNAAGNSVSVYAPTPNRVSGGCDTWKENRYPGATAIKTSPPYTIAQITVTRSRVAAIHSSLLKIHSHRFGGTTQYSRGLKRLICSFVANVLLQRKNNRGSFGFASG